MMSGAYAKEYEKWLETKSTNCNESAMVHTINSDSKDKADNPPRRGSVSSVESLEVAGDVAPILTDDEENDCEFDDDVHSGTKHRFEEEPPILEPVPSMPNQNQSCKSSGFHEPSITCVSSARRGKEVHQSFSNSNDLVPNNMDVNKKKLQECEKKDAYYHNDRKKVDDEFSSKRSGNIFDKFNTISEHADDVPPPLILIPTPDDLPAASADCGDENLNVKVNNSPDFCAMEADSTTEILKTNVQDFHSKKIERPTMLNSQGDASIECDSTCMLGVSPNVASPGFASSVDLDDTGNQSDTQGVTRGLTDELKEQSSSGSPQNESLLNQSAGCQVKEKGNTSKSCSWEQECPTLEAAVVLMEEEEEERKDSKMHKDVLTEEPPILSMSVPESVQILRRKRHTIDTVENIASSAKRKHNMSTSPLASEERFNSDLLKPPELPRQECGGDMSSQHGSKHLKSSSKKISSNTSKKSHRMKSKKRCRSYSVVDSRKFIERSTELSHLQSQMHKLISLLFPQVKIELERMSPESVQFENVLIDLASSSPQPPVDAPGNSERCETSVTDIVDAPEKIPTYAMKLSKDVDHQPRSSCNSSCVASFHHKESNIVSAGHSTVSVSTPCLFRERRLLDNQSSSDTMIPQLSQLTLTSENEKILKRQPSVVIRANVCEVLCSFSRLACNVLQMLLPDLTINLFDALGDSYHDLLNLIDSVILSNSGQ